MSLGNQLKYRLIGLFHKTVMQRILRWSRGMTLGARTAVIDAQGRFLLVKHSYAPGWLFPGGGVERGETCEAAAIRELHEEARVTPKGKLQFFGFYSNHAAFPGDHLAFYVLRDYDWNGFTPTLEIESARFFGLDELPDDTLPSTRRRIDELTGKTPVSLLW